MPKPSPLGSSAVCTVETKATLEERMAAEAAAQVAAWEDAWEAAAAAWQANECEAASEDRDAALYDLLGEVRVGSPLVPPQVPTRLTSDVPRVL